LEKGEGQIPAQEKKSLQEVSSQIPVSCGTFFRTPRHVSLLPGQFSGRAFIDAQFNFILHMICVDWDLHRKAVYDETIVHTQRPALWEGAHCVCGWAAFSGTAAARNRRIENSYCDTVLARLTGVEVICKRSAKRKTGTTATYPAESKRKQRLRWATASQDQAKRRKVDTKARKQALAATKGPNPA